MTDSGQAERADGPSQRTPETRGAAFSSTQATPQALRHAFASEQDHAISIGYLGPR
jgi:hypothetical protein